VISRLHHSCTILRKTYCDIFTATYRLTSLLDFEDNYKMTVLHKSAFGYNLGFARKPLVVRCFSFHGVLPQKFELRFYDAGTNGVICVRIVRRFVCPLSKTSPMYNRPCRTRISNVIALDDRAPRFTWKKNTSNGISVDPFSGHPGKQGCCFSAKREL